MSKAKTAATLLGLAAGAAIGTGGAVTAPVTVPLIAGLGFLGGVGGAGVAAGAHEAGVRARRRWRERGENQAAAMTAAKYTTEGMRGRSVRHDLDEEILGPTATGRRAHPADPADDFMWRVAQPREAAGLSPSILKNIGERAELEPWEYPTCKINNQQGPEGPGQDVLDAESNIELDGGNNGPLVIKIEHDGQRNQNLLPYLLKIKRQIDIDEGRLTEQQWINKYGGWTSSTNSNLPQSVSTAHGLSSLVIFEYVIDNEGNFLATPKKSYNDKTEKSVVSVVIPTYNQPHLLTRVSSQWRTRHKCMGSI